MTNNSTFTNNIFSSFCHFPIFTVGYLHKNIWFAILNSSSHFKASAMQQNFSFNPQLNWFVRSFSCLRNSLDCSFHYQIYKLLCGAFLKIFYGNFESHVNFVSFPISRKVPSARYCCCRSRCCCRLVAVVAGYIQVTAASQLCRSALSYVSGLNSAHTHRERKRTIKGVPSSWSLLRLATRRRQCPPRRGVPAVQCWAEGGGGNGGNGVRLPRV